MCRTTRWSARRRGPIGGPNHQNESVPHTKPMRTRAFYRMHICIPSSIKRFCSDNHSRKYIFASFPTDYHSYLDGVGLQRSTGWTGWYAYKTCKIFWQTHTQDLSNSLEPSVLGIILPPPPPPPPPSGTIGMVNSEHDDKTNEDLFNGKGQPYCYY